MPPLLSPPPPFRLGRSVADPSASIASTMQRVMIQLDADLLERAKGEARRRGVSFPQLVRDAIARELAISAEPAVALSCMGAVDSKGAARARDYRPEPWR